MSIREKAADPLQYDGDEIKWNEEGHGLSPIRRVFLEQLTPLLGKVSGKTVLDLGCGQGWLSSELSQHGGRVVGIDPSQKNITAATEQFPDVTFVCSDIESYESSKRFDLVTALMVFEHFPDLGESLEKIKGLLKPGGELVTIIGDFDKFTHSRFGYTVEVEEITSGEAATRTDYGERAGIIYDINRTTDRFTDIAAQVGFQLLRHHPVSAPGWLIEEHPRYAEHNGAPLFHLLEFELA